MHLIRCWSSPTSTPCAYFLRIAWCIDCYALDANPEFGFDAPEVRRSFVSKAANGVTIENAGIALPNWRLCRSTPKRKRLQSDAAKSTHDDWKALPFGERHVDAGKRVHGSFSSPLSPCGRGAGGEGNLAP